MVWLEMKTEEECRNSFKSSSLPRYQLYACAMTGRRNVGYAANVKTGLL